MADLIDRQQAIDAVHGMRLSDDQSDDEKGAFQLALTLAIGVLREVPSAQTMRKKGRWKRRLVDSGFNADWHCSKCGWKTAIEEHGYNYCPHCGADMRGEKANENNIQ